MARSFAYDGNEVNGGAGWTFPLGLVAEGSYSYRHESYAGESALEGTLSPQATPPGTGSKRRDNEHQVLFALHKALSNHLSVIASYLGDFNNSNDSRFAYDRHIGSLALEVRF
jgi:hypothetical protein